VNVCSEFDYISLLPPPLYCPHTVIEFRDRLKWKKSKHSNYALPSGELLPLISKYRHDLRLHYYNHIIMIEIDRIIWNVYDWDGWQKRLMMAKDPFSGSCLFGSAGRRPPRLNYFILHIGGGRTFLSFYDR